MTLSINFNDASPEEWGNFLEKASAEKQKSEKPLYIMCNSKDGTLFLNDNSTKSKEFFKISVENIAIISKAKLEEVQKEFEKGPVSKLKNLHLKTVIQIHSSTKTFIDARENKLNRNAWCQKPWRVFAAVLSVVGIIPLLIAKRIFNKTQSQIKQTKEKIDKPFYQILNDDQSGLMKKYGFKGSAELYRHQNKSERLGIESVEQYTKMKKTFFEFPNTFNLRSDADRQQGLNELLKENYPDDPDNVKKNVVIFEADMGRNLSFVRIDPKLKTNDSITQPKPTPLDTVTPLGKVTSDMRIEEGAALLHELCPRKEDRRWEIALQLVSTQSVLINLLGTTFTMFKMDHLENWTNPQDGIEYRLKADFANAKMPPIQLNVHRDEQSGNIREVRVKVEAFSDFIAYHTGPKDVPEQVLASKAYKASMDFRVTLNEKGHPLIDNLKTSLEQQPSLKDF